MKHVYLLFYNTLTKPIETHTHTHTVHTHHSGKLVMRSEESFKSSTLCKFVNSPEEDHKQRFSAIFAVEINLPSFQQNTYRDVACLLAFKVEFISGFVSLSWLGNPGTADWPMMRF